MLYRFIDYLITHERCKREYPRERGACNNFSVEDKFSSGSRGAAIST